MPRLSQPVTDEDHSQGPPDAPVTLVEYGDYQCPSCGRLFPIVRALQAQLGDQLRYVFRHFPLTTLHARAERAAEAAEAAGAQGRFWEMHDELYENQDELSDAELIEYAEEIGLDGERVARELAEQIHQPRVRRDFLSGVRSGVNGTPTFFINGQRHDAGLSADALLDALRQAATSRRPTSEET